MELIKDWKNIFGDKDIVNRYIDEIQSNFFLNNNASVNLLIYALLEWLFEKEIENLQPYKRYNKIKDNLKLLFEELNLLNIYNHFIENNLFKIKTEYSNLYRWGDECFCTVRCSFLLEFNTICF